MAEITRGWDQVNRAFTEAILVDGTRGLARRLGVSPAFISKVAKGESPITERLAAGLGFSVETVVTYRRKAK